MPWEFQIVAVISGVASAAIWFYILIDAFQEAPWKGIVGMLCCLYLLYYALFEFKHFFKGYVLFGAILTALIPMLLFIVPIVILGSGLTD